MRQNKIINKGFTLLELLIVVAIIGLLITIALPAVQEILREGRIRTMQASLEGLAVIVTTVEMLHPEHDDNLCAPHATLVRFIEDKADINTVLDRNAGIPGCVGHPDMARLCLQVDRVIEPDGTVSRLCGDSEGNIYIHGACVAAGADAGICGPGIDPTP